jgi:hypothetical protein
MQVAAGYYSPLFPVSGKNPGEVEATTNASLQPRCLVCSKSCHFWLFHSPDVRFDMPDTNRSRPAARNPRMSSVFMLLDVNSTSSVLHRKE